MNVVYKKLEDVCEILDSRRVPITAKDRKAGDYPYYGANGLQDYVADYIFDDELVLLAEDGGNFGSKERPIAYRVSGKCWVNNHAHVLKAKPNMHVDYLCYALMFYDTEGLVNGATRQKLTQAAMRQMVIPYRDMTEQLQIIKKISQIVRSIEKRKEELQLLDQLVKSRFIELFGDPMTDVSKWSASTIGEQFNVASGGTPATGEKVYWENGTIPWIGSNMCQDTILSENDGKFITEEGYAHSSAKWFHKGTVLVALVGATIGKTALLRFDTTTNQNIAAIDVTQNAAFSSEFVFYHMQMLYSKFMEIGSGKFKMANQGFIRQLPLICPPIELQQQFAAFVEQTDKSKYYSSLSFRYCQAAENAYRQEWITCRTSDF